MSATTYTVAIDATPARVWAVLADFGGIYRWNPGVKSSHLTSARGEGVGITRHCDLSPVGALEERVSGWRENEQLDIEIRGDWRNPIATAQASFALAPLDSGARTLLRFTVDYTPRFGVLGPVLDNLMIKKIAPNGFRGLAAGLKHHVETGRTGVPADELPLHAVTVS